MPAEELPREVYDQEDTPGEHSFDELAKGMADGNLSRRQALKLLSRAFIGATFGFWFLRSTEARGASVEAELELEGSEAEQEIEQRIGGGGGGDAGCPPERLCPRNTCCPAGEICASGGGVCCPPQSVCTVGGVPQACCAGIGTCENGVCVPSVP